MPDKVWNVILHPLVMSEDFKKMDRPAKKLILKSIHKKLTQDPENYGSPLVGPYKGYWKLRVADYRVIYRIVKDRVLVIVVKVGIRRNDEIYQNLFHRLKKL